MTPLRQHLPRLTLGCHSLVTSSPTRPSVANAYQAPPPSNDVRICVMSSITRFKMPSKKELKNASKTNIIFLLLLFPLVPPPCSSG